MKLPHCNYVVTQLPLPSIFFKDKTFIEQVRESLVKWIDDQFGYKGDKFRKIFSYYEMKDKDDDEIHCHEDEKRFHCVNFSKYIKYKRDREDDNPQPCKFPRARCKWFHHIVKATTLVAKVWGHDDFEMIYDSVLYSLEGGGYQQWHEDIREEEAPGQPILAAIVSMSDDTTLDIITKVGNINHEETVQVKAGHVIIFDAKNLTHRGTKYTKENIRFYFKFGKAPLRKDKSVTVVPTETCDFCGESVFGASRTHRESCLSYYMQHKNLSLEEAKATIAKRKAAAQAHNKKTSEARKIKRHKSKK